MNNKIPLIRQELDRRFHACSTPKTHFWGFLVVAQDYTDFVKNTPILTQIVESEMKNLEQGFRGSSHNPFNPIFPKLYVWFTEETKRLVTERKEIKKESFWNSFLKKINNAYSRKRQEHAFRTTLNLIHDNFMKALAAREIGSFEHTVKKASEVVRSLKISDSTTWDLLTICLTGYYDVKITHGEKEYISNHEKMGFADNRKPNETRAIGCWRLLQLLAIGNGIFKLPYNKNEREKCKKQKQELTQRLKEYFQITEDPFYTFQGDQSEYRIKIHLIATPEFRDDWKDRNISESTSRHEFLKPIDSI